MRFAPGLVHKEGRRGCYGGPFRLSKNLILRMATTKTQGGARGGEARLELDQMPRNALRGKACGERSENFVLQLSTKFRHYFRLSKESEWTFLTA